MKKLHVDILIRMASICLIRTIMCTYNGTTGVVLLAAAAFALIASGSEANNQDWHWIANRTGARLPQGALYMAVGGARPANKLMAGPPKKVYKIDLSGDPTMPYVGRIGIGRPRQMFDVLYDTGTAHIWLPSPSCLVNEKPWTSDSARAKFNGALSSTFSQGNPKPRCYRHPELGLKLHATLLEDTVELADSRDASRLMALPGQQISVIYKVSSTRSNQFSLPYDGWVGLCLPGGEGDDTVNLLANLALHETVEEPIFTLYTTLKIVPNPETGKPERKTELVIGEKELDKLRYVPPIAWTPVTRAPFWEIRVHSMKLMEQYAKKAILTVCDHGCEAMLRTGSRFISGPRAAIEALNKELGFMQRGQIDRDTFVAPMTCAQLAESRTQKPSLMFQIGDVQGLEVKYDMLMMNELAPDGKEICVSALRGGESAKWTLGAPFTMNFYTIFDFGKKQVGIAKASRPRSLRD